MKPAVKFRLPLWKRAFDLLFSTVSIIVLSPVMIAVTVAIRIESRGSVFYAARRVGPGYRIFKFYKFRSMYTDADKRMADLGALNQYKAEQTTDPTNDLSAENDFTMLIADDRQVSESEYIRTRRARQAGVFIKLQSDPRVTRVGRFIRKYSLDELPQLFNILKGDMSVVGNRPLPLYEAEKLTTDQDSVRFMAPAGLTGLWQVERRGKYNTMSADERKQLDIRYAQHYNLCMDLRIIFRTFTSFIQKEDV